MDSNGNIFLKKSDAEKAEKELKHGRTERGSQ